MLRIRYVGTAIRPLLAESSLFYLSFWEEFMTALPQKRPFSVLRLVCR